MRLCRWTPVLLLIALLFCGCGSEEGALQNGYFTAEAAEYDTYGWKEYVTIYVSEDRIVTVEYNAKNASGFIKSWDMDYMQVMNAVDGTYPNEYTRAYANDLVSRQDPSEVDAIAGATHSYHSFQLLAAAAVENAKNGTIDIAYVELPPAEEE